MKYKIFAATGAAVVLGWGSVANAATVLQYQVFNSAFSDVPVGTIITLSLDFDTNGDTIAGDLPAQSQPPYDVGAGAAGNEDALGGAQQSRFADIAVAEVTFLGRTINGINGEVLTFASQSPTGEDRFRITFEGSELSGDLDFDSITQSPPPRQPNGLNIEFVGVEGTINDQFIETALAVDPFAWTEDAGNGLQTKAPRRLQFTFGAPGFPEINATLVPVPAAVWLFGSALGALGWLRRRS